MASVHFFIKCLYFLASLNYLESKVFIATASGNPTALSGESLDRMEQLWIWTLHPTTPTPLHPTMWMGNTEGKGFVLDLGAMLAINKIEIGNINVKSMHDDRPLIISYSPGSILG